MEVDGVFYKEMKWGAILPNQVPRSTCLLKKKNQANESENLAQSFLTRCPDPLAFKRTSKWVREPENLAKWFLTRCQQPQDNLCQTSEVPLHLSPNKYNDDDAYHLNCHVSFTQIYFWRAFNWHKHVFSCKFYLLLCHDQTPKHDRLIPIAIKTISIRSTRNTVWTESCKICRVHCKTHGSFVTVIMNNQTRNMYIQCQKRAIITPYKY